MPERIITAGLAFIIVAGFFATLAGILYLPAGSEIKDILKIMVGLLGALATQVGNFYFGSSAGSKRKTEALAGPPSE